MGESSTFNKEFEKVNYRWQYENDKIKQICLNLKDSTFSPQSTDIENNQDDYFEDEVTEVNYVSFNYCSA